jgi:hypothetical protein
MLRHSQLKFWHIFNPSLVFESKVKAMRFGALLTCFINKYLPARLSLKDLTETPYYPIASISKLAIKAKKEADNAITLSPA